MNNLAETIGRGPHPQSVLRRALSPGRLGKQVKDIRSKLRGIVVPVSVDLPRWPSESPVVFTSPSMNRRVSGLHLIVRTHIDGGRHSARGSRSIAALLDLNAACDLKLARDA